MCLIICIYLLPILVFKNNNSIIDTHCVKGKTVYFTCHKNTSPGQPNGGEENSKLRAIRKTTANRKTEKPRHSHQFAQWSSCVCVCLLAQSSDEESCSWDLHAEYRFELFAFPNCWFVGIRVTFLSVSVRPFDWQSQVTPQAKGIYFTRLLDWTNAGHCLLRHIYIALRGRTGTLMMMIF